MIAGTQEIVGTWLIRIKIVKKMSPKNDLIVDLMILIEQLMSMDGSALQRRGNQKFLVRLFEDLMCWSLKLDNDLVLLEVNVKKSVILKPGVGLLIDLIKNSISHNSRVIIRGSS